MEVEAVNVGRRPVVLRLVGGYYENGDWNGQNVGEGKTGVRLEENERYSENIDDLRYLVRDHETGGPVTELWFEPTRGRRYRIKGAKKHLKQFFKQSKR